ncbi:hypothetical protein [Chryseolinea sp. H1M3-3]|uniref:DUF3244 domain-containing protein n=1 Tax=Chryseolinea sp. H1M3-3 TaxID=3034144 RepID=UPI0023ECF8F8|nr:hypothetical protein [Chryseolinea sp. H1M3-3]
MKTKSIYLVAVLLLSAVATFGNDEPKKAGVAVLHGKGTEVFKVIYQNETTGKVKINVYNVKSELVYSESINNTDGFILPLNFSQMSFGEYTVELTDANGKQVEKIVYQPAAPVENIRIAKLSSEGKFIVSVVKTSGEKVTVRIFDNANNLLHNEVKSVSGDFAQVYTVKNLSGACTFEVTDNEGRVKTVKF